MRIVGGMWRGRSFEAPEGRATRPTTDRMRESLASMILSACGLSLANVSVLDAFAGSGGMGLELLSRGAKHCTFCERDPRTAGVVRRNCMALGVPRSDYAIVVCDVMRFAACEGAPGAPYDIVFLDPPYAMGVQEVAKLVRTLVGTEALLDQALVVYERSLKGDPLELEGFVAVRQKRQGSTCIDMLQRSDAS